MESGDCGRDNKLPFSSVFDSNARNKAKTQVNDSVDDNSCNVSLKKDKPRKVIHFSDGTIEEYSSDEDEPDRSAQMSSEINTRTLPWGPWIWHHTVNVGSKSLQVCDFLGEHLASFFGITTPKYQYEIDEYNRIMVEEEDRQKKEELELGGWTDVPSDLEGTVKTPPTAHSDPGDKF